MYILCKYLFIILSLSISLFPLSPLFLTNSISMNELKYEQAGHKYSQ